MSTELYDKIMRRLDEIESLVRSQKQTGDRVGGIELAIEVTGYATRTIYKKIKDPVNPMPHRKDGTLKFSEKELRDWMLSDRKESVILQVKQRPKGGRQSLLQRSLAE